jgi:hypothetical protein|tara:strand:- start:8633 stop:8941 length:309 start_codon:yes stop_codon:yes gene_type:complete
MKNQFFYTRKEPIQDTDPVEYTERVDSINVDKIIRSVQMEDDSIVILLDDMHERIREVANINPKTNKVSGTKKMTEVYQTEVYLYGENIKRFRNLTNIVNND